MPAPPDAALARVLTELERDESAEAAARVVGVAVDYLASTRHREARVSTAHTPRELAARFDEPLPRSGATLEAVAEHLAREVVPDANHLYHPRYVGHH